MKSDYSLIPFTILFLVCCVGGFACGFNVGEIAGSGNAENRAYTQIIQEHRRNPFRVTEGTLELSCADISNTKFIIVTQPPAPIRLVNTPNGSKKFTFQNNQIDYR